MTETNEATASGRDLVNAVFQCIEFPRSIRWSRSSLGRWFALIEGDHVLIIDFDDSELTWATQGPESRRRLVTVAEERISVAKHREQVRAQQHSSATERRYQEDSRLLSLILASHDVLFELSSNLDIRFLSPAWTRFTGHDVLESLDRPFAEFLHSDDRPAVMEMLESVREGRLFTAETEVRVPCSEDELRYFQMSVERRYEFDGITVAAIYGTLHDITKLKEREQELLATKLDAEKATLEKSMFLASMSHEIRTPMNGVLGMLEAMLEERPTKQQKEYLSVMKRSCGSLLGILNDLLDISKAEAGKLELEMVPFDPQKVLRDVMSLMQSRADEKGLELKLDLPVLLPTPLLGDPMRLTQVLTNLVGNAVKFTKIGSVTLRARVEETSESNVVLLFSVADSGIGIPESRRADIFEEYAQVDVDTARKFGGTGLGLSICRRLTELMGGMIACESEVGKGSHFWFTAVFELVRRPGRRAPAKTEGADDVPARDRKDLGHLRILIADDAPVNRLVASTILKKTGCALETAENGEEAIEVLRRVRCDLVLMDVQMPEMSGLEATWEIRKLEQSDDSPFQHPGSIPIVALTASVTPEERRRCMDAGMDSFLGKPLDSELLVSTVAELCRNATAEPTT